MPTPITVNLPNAVYERAQRLADLTKRPVEEVGAMLLAISMPTLPPSL